MGCGVFKGVLVEVLCDRIGEEFWEVGDAVCAWIDNEIWNVEEFEVAVMVGELCGLPVDELWDEIAPEVVEFL